MAQKLFVGEQGIESNFFLLFLPFYLNPTALSVNLYFNQNIPDKSGLLVVVRALCSPGKADTELARSCEKGIAVAAAAKSELQAVPDPFLAGI